MSIDYLLQSLNPMQQEAVLHQNGPCLIIAGAGTGKTKTLTTRIAALIENGVNPNRILAVTFTNKAAAQMRERVEALAPGQSGRVWIHTFHSFGVRLLRQNAHLLKLTKDFAIYDESEQKKIITLVLQEMGQKDAKKEINQYISLISRAKDDMIDPESFAISALASNIDFKIRAAEVYKRYQNKLNAAGALDFGDLLVKTAELLKNNEDVREYYQNIFQHILVDEYQDTNHTQYIITRTLAYKHRNLCVVGDPDQSIYSWRGANIRNILEFEKDFPDAKIITLEQNYRSTQIILDSSNKLIKKNKKRKDKSLYSNKTSGEPIEVRELLTEGEEARWTAQNIANLIEDGASLNDIAVFYRTNAQSRNFEDNFRKYQLPYRLIGAVRFYDRREIKDILGYARVLVNPLDTVSLLRILNTPKRGIGKTAEEKFLEYANLHNISLYQALQRSAFVEGLTPTARRAAQEFINLMDTLRLELKVTSPTDIVNKILTLSGYWKAVEDEVEKDLEAGARLDNLQELVNAVKEYEERMARTEREASLSDFVQEISLITGADEKQDSSAGAVTLMTVHLAKGLEFPVVFVSGLEEGLFPLSSKDDDDLEEERRLCYVAMTRAKDRLFMTYTSTRRIFGKMYTNLPSRFLFESGLITEEQEGPLNRQSTVMPNYGGYKTKYGSKYGETQNRPSFKPFFAAPKKQKKYDEHGYEIEEQEGDYGAPIGCAPLGIAGENEAPAVHVSAQGPRTGQRVRHGVFGDGKVIVIAGSGEAAKITVMFANGVKRTFMLKYAPLQLL
ncbi:Superfamily I DNA and RNA helicase [Elusimicrobium minutum Pei191]|uniref:DNA 3'-5' helicase n=1 Tax=Elusimicrobium minutum (strain Pei191) TaxID=445932 RepID=B2KB12_ELUMP|nr:UvrD-helicase domain-containing protein [Elusimicrobium minutum]ACC97771.1 Superfamily I DNA and RNA helicase [Elusimicrobium minutum Pei191]